MEIVELLGNVLLFELQRNKFTRFAQGSVCESFIIGLLNGKILDPGMIEVKLNSLKWSLKDYIYVLTVRANHSAGKPDTDSIDNIMAALQAFITGSRTVLYNDDIVLIFSCSKEILCLDTKFTNLIKLLVKNQLHAGISRSARSLVDVSNCYRQSVKAIELGARMAKSTSIFNYEDYTICHVLEICAEQENLINFCHPNFLSLVEYDRKNATSFVLSLRTFLENDKNLAKAAAVLHIHRNTMSYRLEKIAEIMQLDLSDGDVILQLFFSFKILEYIKHYKNNYRQVFEKEEVFRSSPTAH